MPGISGVFATSTDYSTANEPVPNPPPLNPGYGEPSSPLNPSGPDDTGRGGGGGGFVSAFRADPFGTYVHTTLTVMTYEYLAIAAAAGIVLVGTSVGPITGAGVFAGGASTLAF